MKFKSVPRKFLTTFLLFIFGALLVPVLAQFPMVDPGVAATAKTASDPSNFLTFKLDRFNLDFFGRLLINLLSMFVLVRLIYFSVYRRRDFFFTFFMFNLVIFIITVLLNSNSGFSIGAAFGLFAIFAMLRYRTEDISARDMTYLFMSITIGLITSINMGSALEIVIINAIIILMAFLIEGNVFFKPEFIKVIEYEKIDLIKPENKALLIKDLQDRTGLDVHKVYIKRIDFLRDTALIKVYYHSTKNRDE